MSLVLTHCPNIGRHLRFRLTRRLLSGGALGLVVAIPAFADPAPVIFNGTPEQVIPTYSEVGVGNITTNTGTTSINGGGTTTGGGTTSTTTSSDLTTMENQSWGDQAAQNAEALGVNPNALAATCVVESQCQNLAASGSSSAAGPFQMISSTYQSSLAKALASDPSLADNIVEGSAGQMDPATESIAAAQYLKDTADTLEADGVSNPTVLDVRGGYNFGNGYAAALAEADNSELMSDVLDGASATTLKNNGVTSTTTVGQWRQKVSASLGNAANQSALTG